MSPLPALASLGVIWTIAGCFNPSYGNCRITCSPTEACPSGLRCIPNSGDSTGAGLCAPPGTLSCSADNPDADAGADGDGDDAMDAADTMDGADAMDGGSDGDAGSGPPEILCHGGSCLTLPPAVRANLVLLLWPSNLPAVGSTVAVWPDQSGHGNDARVIYNNYLPRVIQNGVQLEASQLGRGFQVSNSPSLDFGAGDFAIIVVAGLTSSTTNVSFFRKSDGLRENSRQISLDWVRSASNTGQPQATVNDSPVVTTTTDIPQPSVRAYTVRRTGDHLDLHVNEAVLGSADLPTAGLSTTNAQNVYLGVAGIVGSPADSIAAVIAIRGSIDSADLNQLLAFLRTTFATPP